MPDAISDFKVYETFDYDKFGSLLGNRSAKTEAKIIESIREIGHICMPLLVNEKYEIIDGQNRLAAWKALKLPVYYIIMPGLGIREARFLNIGRQNWSTQDYIGSYAETGIEDYKRLASLLTTFQKAFSLQGVMAMAKPTKLTDGGGSYSTCLKEGKYQLSQEEYELAIVRMTAAKKAGYVAWAKRKKPSLRIFWACVSYIYQHRRIVAKDVIKALIKYEASIPCVNKVSEQLKYFDDAYNRDIRKAQDKVFLSSDFQRREYL